MIRRGRENCISRPPPRQEPQLVGLGPRRIRTCIRTRGGCTRIRTIRNLLVPTHRLPAWSRATSGSPWYGAEAICRCNAPTRTRCALLSGARISGRRPCANTIWWATASKQRKTVCSRTRRTSYETDRRWTGRPGRASSSGRARSLFQKKTGTTRRTDDIVLVIVHMLKKIPFT